MGHSSSRDIHKHLLPGEQHKRTQRCSESGSTSRRIWYFPKANISGKKKTKGFQFAAQARHNSKEKVERGDAQKRAGETVQSTPGSNPSRQETLSEDERLDGPTVEQLLCSLENARNESEAGFATLCQTMQNAGKEDEASNQAYEAQEALLEEYISPGPQAQTKGAKIPRYQKETKVCKPKERAKTEKDTRPCNKSGSTKRVRSSKS